MSGALVRLATICEALPEATREDSPPHAGWRVRGRTFAYFLDDHQGDGIVGLVCKAPTGAAEALVAGEPERFYRAQYLWHRGWVGYRLDTAQIDWGEVEALVVDSYALVAPRRLVALVEPEGPK